MMASEEKTMVIGLVLVGLYLYQRRQQQVLGGMSNPAAAGRMTMPGSAGIGAKQVAANALTGFLQGALSGIRNGPAAYVPSLNNNQQAATDWMSSGTVQDVATPEDAGYAMWA